LDDQVAAAVAAYKPTLVSVGSPKDVDKYAQKLIKDQDQEAAFMMFDLGMVTRLYEAWKTTMPRVEPFYGEPRRHLLFRGLPAGVPFVMCCCSKEFCYVGSSAL
jgi:hypothetical protein